jgi:hypothetical protein
MVVKGIAPCISGDGSFVKRNTLDQNPTGFFLQLKGGH